MVRILCPILILICNAMFVSSHADYNPSPVLFHHGFNSLYGEPNIVPYDGNTSVQISIDETTSSGFLSKHMYVHGYFETSLKLPENYTAGVVVTYYTCNNLKYPYRHDEIDLEFLGHGHGQKWVLQTNFYGNGSTNRGREERYGLWFDPSEDFHRYGILWTRDRITYYVDGIPIRHVRRVESMGGDFPSKEMSLFATIWNGSDWATSGGQYKMDLKYGPFVAKYSGLVLNGCRFNQTVPETRCDGVKFSDDITLEERVKMNGFRRKWMTYSYCYDKKRYDVPLPECVFNAKEFTHLQQFDPWTFGSRK